MTAESADYDDPQYGDLSDVQVAFILSLSNTRQKYRLAYRMGVADERAKHEPPPMHEVEWQSNGDGTTYTERFASEAQARRLFASLHIDKGYAGELVYIILRSPDGTVLDQGHWEE